MRRLAGEDALADGDGGVRDGADVVRAGREEGFVAGEIPAADDGDDDLVPQRRQHRAEHVLQNRRDNRRDNPVALRNDVRRRPLRVDAELICGFLQFVKMAGAGVNILRRADVPGKQPLCNRAAHVAKADESNFHLGFLLNIAPSR